MVAQVQTLSSLIAEDVTFVEGNDAERASLSEVTSIFAKFTENAAAGVASFQDAAARNAFVGVFQKLAAKDSALVVPDGVSFADLNAFVARSFSEQESSKTLQRIANKQLAAQKAEVTEEAPVEQPVAEAVEEPAAE